MSRGKKGSERTRGSLGQRASRPCWGFGRPKDSRGYPGFPVQRGGARDPRSPAPANQWPDFQPEERRAEGGRCPRIRRKRSKSEGRASENGTDPIDRWGGEGARALSSPRFKTPVNAEHFPSGRCEAAKEDPSCRAAGEFVKRRRGLILTTRKMGERPLPPLAPVRARPDPFRSAGPRCCIPRRPRRDSLSSAITPICLARSPANGGRARATRVSHSSRGSKFSSGPTPPASPTATCHPPVNLALASMAVAAPRTHNTRRRRIVYARLRGGHSMPNDIARLARSS